MKKLGLFVVSACWAIGCLAAEPVYFIVAGFLPAATNSFLLPLTSSADITKARMIAAAGGGGGYDSTFPGAENPGPVVRIRLGSDGINRDMLAPSQPLWSWHVDELVYWHSASSFEIPYQLPLQVQRDVVAGTFLDETAVAFQYCGVIAELNPPFVLYVENVQYAQGAPERFFYWTHNASKNPDGTGWDLVIHPEGIESVSPGSRGTSYPGPGTPTPSPTLQGLKPFLPTDDRAWTMPDAGMKRIEGLNSR